MPRRSRQAACSQTWRLAVDKEHGLSQCAPSLWRSPCLWLIGPSGYLHSGECLYTSIYSDMWQCLDTYTQHDCVHCCQSVLENPSLYGYDLTIASPHLNTLQSILLNVS